MKRNVFNMSIVATDRWDALDSRMFPFLHSKDSRNFQVPLQSPSLSLWLFTTLVMKLWSILIAPIERWKTFSGRKLARALSLIVLLILPFSIHSPILVGYEAEISLFQEHQIVGWSDGMLRSCTTLGTEDLGSLSPGLTSGGSHLPITSALGDRIPFSGFHNQNVYFCAHTHTQKHIHTCDFKKSNK